MAPAGKLLRKAQTRLIGQCAPFQAPEAALLATQLNFSSDPEVLLVSLATY
jgi:hypothetical protein